MYENLFNESSTIFCTDCMKISILTKRWRSNQDMSCWHSDFCYFTQEIQFFYLPMECTCRTMMDRSQSIHELKCFDNLHQSQMVFLVHVQMVLFETRKPFSCCTFPNSIMSVNGTTPLLNSKQKDMSEMPVSSAWHAIFFCK